MICPKVIWRECPERKEQLRDDFGYIEDGCAFWLDGECCEVTAARALKGIEYQLTKSVTTVEVLTL